MPIHDWTRVDAGLFHTFHQHWITRLCDALNDGKLPPDFFALSEQSIGRPIPDVLTLELDLGGEGTDRPSTALAVASTPPRARLIAKREDEVYARRTDRVAIRHRHGRVVAVIEIVSPGNKSGKSAFRTFVEKTADLIESGIHVLVIDLFPPTRRDPQGIHKAIWDEFEEERDFESPPGKPLILASYDAGPPTVAYVESVGVGDTLPEMPIFLTSDLYVPAPLESSYQLNWRHFPAPMKRLLEQPPTPSDDR